MLLIIVAAIVVIVCALLVLVARRPSTFLISRGTSVVAPAAIVFTQVNDLHRWNDWSPWAKLDPGMKQTFDGPPAGPGAGYAWSGNKKVGTGRMTITESRAPEFIRLRLEFQRPFTATNTAEFTFRPAGNQTGVTWSMSGRSNFMFKLFGLIVNMDQLVGRDFEKGLAQLKTVAEASAGQQSRR
jgi:hypothetical protein